VFVLIPSLLPTPTSKAVALRPPRWKKTKNRYTSEQVEDPTHKLQQAAYLRLA
jgi:hypothetical protein